MIHVAAIDVGLCNLGFVYGRVEVDHSSCTIDSVQRINLTQLEDLHKRVPKHECKLYHTADAVDRVQHFLQEHMDVLETMQVVLIERQPLGGLVHVEQLLYQAFRDKAVLCNPRTIHCHFDMTPNEYERRKEESVEIAEPYVRHLDGWKAADDRQHDIADAVCMLVWWNHQQHLRHLREVRKVENILPPLCTHHRDKTGSPTITLPLRDVNSFFEQFRFGVSRQNKAE
jgi:hypothetical protein